LRTSLTWSRVLKEKWQTAMAVNLSSNFFT
jgi:hypothetical protein